MTTLVSRDRAAIRDLYIEQGTDWVESFQILDDSGSVVSLAGTQFRGQIRRLANSTTVIATFTFAVNFSTNTVTVSLADTDTASITLGETEDDPANRFVYDYEWVRADGSVDRIQRGNLILSPEVTR